VKLQIRRVYKIPNIKKKKKQTLIEIFHGDILFVIFETKVIPNKKKRT
jgi:hypothetical protein